MIRIISFSSLLFFAFLLLPLEASASWSAYISGGNYNRYSHTSSGLAAWEQERITAYNSNSTTKSGVPTFYRFAGDKNCTGYRVCRTFIAYQWVGSDPVPPIDCSSPDIGCSPEIPQPPSCDPPNFIDPATDECVVVDDAYCQGTGNVTHVSEITPQDMFSGNFGPGVQNGTCEFQLDMESEKPVDCYQKANGNFQCYLDMAPTGVADSDLNDVIAPIEGGDDSATVEESTETNNDTGTTTETEVNIDVEPDGKKVTTEKETVTESDGTETVTTTTTINNIDGTTTTLTNKTINHPDGTSETVLTGSKTESDETNESKAVTGDCGAPVQCTGDAIQCAILQRNKDNYCQVQEDLEDAAKEISEKTSGVGDLGDDGLDLTNNTDVNVSEKVSGWQNVSDPTPSQCPAPRQISLALGNFEVKFEPWCEFAQQIRPFTIFMFSFIGAMAIARTFTS